MQEQEPTLLELARLAAYHKMFVHKVTVYTRQTSTVGLPWLDVLLRRQQRTYYQKTTTSYIACRTVDSKAHV